MVHSYNCWLGFSVPCWLLPGNLSTWSSPLGCLSILTTWLLTFLRVSVPRDKAKIMPQCFVKQPQKSSTSFPLYSIHYMWPTMSSPCSSVLVSQSCLILCNPMDCSPPGSSVRGNFQARILEWAATPFSRGSSRPRYCIQVSCIADRFFTIWATREAHLQGGVIKFHVLVGKISQNGNSSIVPSLYICTPSCPSLVLPTHISKTEYKPSWNYPNVFFFTFSILFFY